MSGAAGQLAIATPEPATPPATSPHGFVAPVEYVPAFGCASEKATRMRAARWRESLPPEQRARRGRVWFVRTDAVLDHTSDGPGITLERYVQAHRSAPSSISEQVMANPRVAERHRAARQVRRLYERFAAEHQGLGRTTPAFFPAFEAVYGAEVRKLGLSPKRGAMLRMLARLGDDRGDGIVDRRQRGGWRGRAPFPDARVRDAYVAIALSPNFHQLSEAWRCARDAAEGLGLAMPRRGAGGGSRGGSRSPRSPTRKGRGSSRRRACRGSRGSTAPLSRWSGSRSTATS